MIRMLGFALGTVLVAALAAQTPALRKGVSVQQAVTANAVAMPDADAADSVVVAVTRDGSIYLEVTQVTPEQLSEKVKEQLAGHPGKRVYLKSDARTPYATVAEVLGALRAAGAPATVLLTSQPPKTSAAHLPPMGLEVLLRTPAGAAAQPAPALDADLQQRARRDKSVVLQADGAAPYGDIVHAVDVCRAEGAQVFLASTK